MCGLAGTYTYDRRPVDTDALLRMREAMRARGPDGAGLWSDQAHGIALAHRRLAILDLSERAAQPMALADRQLQIVFNGEIYNHPELRAWCEARGARYVSDSDTETLLHLYALEGRSFVKRLRGMFAFALWDGQIGSLLLARDPFGIKPLYYAAEKDQFRFASQVKALLAGGVDATPSPAGVVSFYLWGYVTEPHTWHKAIRALPSGCTLRLDMNGQQRIERYADPLDVLRGAPLATPEVGSLRDAMMDSVRHHLLADVPVGVFLSAGIDSGTLCALMRECQPQGEIRGVTLGFAEYAGTPHDEAPLARETAARYACHQDVIEYGREDFERDRTHLLMAMDQPTVDGVNTYFVSKATAQAGLKVALSGVGGDELFGGYPSFRQIPQIAQRLRRVPQTLGKAMRVAIAPIVARFTSPKYAGLLEYGSTVSGAYLLRRALFMPWEIAGIVGDDVAAEGLAALDIMGELDSITQGINSPYAQVMALEHAIYLKNCLLRDADWAGMAHSLEIRTPLVDAHLFSQLASLRCVTNAPRWKHPLGTDFFNKRDWALTPSKPLPVSQVDRAKSGFTVPVRKWLAMDGQANDHEMRGLRGWAMNLARQKNDVPATSGNLNPSGLNPN
jgi:asparagine synthase (glutamine-hydrolysing)